VHCHLEYVAVLENVHLVALHPDVGLESLVVLLDADEVRLVQFDRVSENGRYVIVGDLGVLGGLTGNAG